MTVPAPPTRRQAVQLGGVIIGAWAASSVLRRAAPVGREIEGAESLTGIINGAGSPVSGPPGASLRLAVFADYRCPACRRAFPAMEDALRADGDVRVIYKDWPIFGPASERAARVALASAEQGVYPVVHRLLMTDGRAIDDNVLCDIVTKAGGNWPRIDAYLTAHAEGIMAQLRTNGEQALSMGLAGTPGYLAGSVLVAGAIDEMNFTRLFARAREVA